MIYRADLILPFDIKKIIEPEILQYKTDFKRVSVVFETNTNIKIEAEDSTSLRAVLNTISKLCTVYEKANTLVKQNE